MRGPPVVLTNTLGRPVTNVISERGAVPMTVVNTLGEPVTLVANGGEPVTLFNANGTLWDYPFSLFANNEQGAWYDPSDFSTLFQNSTGTTPVTAVEQPVRLMLDRSRGLVLGSELNGDPTLTGNGFWGANAGITVGSGKVSYVSTSVGNALFKTLSFLTAGKTYTVSITVANYVAGAVGVETDAPQNALATGNGTFTFIVRSVSSAFYLTARNATTTLDVTNISVRELPGNHALAPNDASRPILRARYNLLERSEEFDNAYWTKTNSTVTANAGVAPDGTTTADTLTENAANDEHYAARAVTKAATATTYTASIYAKSSTRNILILCRQTSASANNATIGVNLTTGAVGLAAAAAGTFTAASGVVTTLANGWFRIALTFTTSTETDLSIRHYITDGTYNGSFAGDGTSGILIWGAQFLTAADQSSTGGAYQRTAAATDYDTSNPVWRPYLAFDGSDDSFSTSAIDFSGTDEMTVFAGVTKLSDAATGVVAELTAGTPNNRFSLRAPGGASADYVWISGGSTLVSATATTYSAPVTNVLTGIGDISGDVATLRVNGAQIATVTTDQGSGNFVDAALFIGARNNASQRLNGRLYSLAVLGRTATTEELSAMEAWVNGKTGAF